MGSGVTSDYRSEGSTSWLADAATVFRGDGDDRTKCRMISGDHRGDHGTAPHRCDEAGRRHDLKIGGHGRNGFVTTPEITDHGAKNASGSAPIFSNRTLWIAGNGKKKKQQAPHNQYPPSSPREHSLPLNYFEIPRFSDATPAAPAPPLNLRPLPSVLRPLTSVFCPLTSALRPLTAILHSSCSYTPFTSG